VVILTAALQKSPTQFIMLPNEVFALECRKRYEEQGLIVDERTIHNGRRAQFAHCPLPKGMGDEGLYLLWGDHQHHGLLQSRDVGRRCFFNGDVKLWLDGFPEGFFELYEIYEEFISGEHNPCYGRTQWKNELTQEQRMSYDKPEGEGWERGQLQKTLDKKSAAVSGEHNPMYGNTGENHPRFGVPKTEEQKKAQSEKMSGRYSGEKNPNYGNTGALSPCSKAIIAIKPDGTELHFGSGHEAARELGISRDCLRTGKSPVKGKFKGWQFLYV